NTPSDWVLDTPSCAVTSPNGGGYNANGATVTVNLKEGEDWTCTYTNHRKPKLTVTKTLLPSGDTGLFNLRIDGTTAGTGANVGNNGTTGAVTVSVGQHTVDEGAGTGTNLSNYIKVIDGDCAADGTITLAAGDNKVCNITNTRSATLTVNKVLNPS